MKAADRKDRQNNNSKESYSRESGQESERDSKKIVLGRVSGVFGVNGWLKIFSYTDPMEAIVDYNPWYMRPEITAAEHRSRMPWTRLKLKAGKRHGKTVVAKLEHCNDRDEAQAFIGYEIAVEQSQLEKDRGENEYYWHELIGLRVINRQGVALGVVESMMETGANDVLVVIEQSEENGNRERLIPWIMDQSIINVDLQAGVLEVDWDPDF